jgi:hypothetical protein
MWLIYFILFFSSLTLAGNTTGDNPAVQPDLPPMIPGSSMSEVKPSSTQRQGILEFEFDPDGGKMIVRVSDANGTKPLEVDSLEFDAIDESGKTIRVQAQKLEKNVFKATLNLTKGEHNLIARVKKADLILDGQFTLGVGEAVTEGRFGLVPPNPEVNRLSWLVGALIGVPLGLGLLIGIWAVLQKLISPKPQKTTSI